MQKMVKRPTSWSLSLERLTWSALLERKNPQKLKITNTFFQKRHSHKWTWRSPNGEIFNEIDYVNSGTITTTKIKTSKWNWVGHAARATDNWADEVLFWDLIGKRNRGRPIIR